MDMPEIKVKANSVQKLEWKETDRQTVQKDGGDRITSGANAVDNKTSTRTSVQFH